MQEKRKFYVVPKDKNLQAWQTLYTSTRRSEIMWLPYTAGSMPPSNPGVDCMYNQVRRVIHASDSLCGAAQVSNNLNRR